MIQLDKPLLDTFGIVDVRGEDVDVGGRFTRKLAVLNGKMSYRLCGPARAAVAQDAVLSRQGMRIDGSLRPSYNADRYGTDVGIIGQGQPHLYGIVMALSGAIRMVGGPNGVAEAHGGKGMILRGLADTRVQTTDNSARLILWLNATRMERALEARIGEPPRRSLAFMPAIDWKAAPGAAVGRLIAHLVDEMRDPRGLTSNALALESFTDLLLQTMLRRLESNYSAQLDRPPDVAIPRHLRRAEAFMHASADQPVTLPDIAAAAGCSVATLQVAFRRFRSTTVLAALHDVRLHFVRRALLDAHDDALTRVIARRFGFTNPSRFIVAYGQRFGEHPNETRQRRR